ncbi:pentraxin-4 [Mastacembelus armatus]|uniref:pentraxin-4 n=1 Tax=Mastacembelus armatus TaxID=205130 RepID=UPI000E453BBA|nr:pentraxin-4 [Mastacembelus armatus]
MGNLRPGHWLLILVHILQLQIQPIKVQGNDPVSQKLRRLNEQFQQFRALTKARLDMLAMNQSRNSSQVLESRIQALNDHYHHMSQDLEHLKQSSTQEIEGLREWSRKLEKKNKRLEGRLALMERNLRENRRHAQKQKPDLSEEFFNLTLEFQSQEERLGALQVQRDELLVGLKGLQESLENQALRVTRLEERLSEVLQWNGGGSLRGSGRVGETLSSNITPQKYDNPHRRSQTHKGGRPGRILGGYTQPRAEGISQTNTDKPSQSKLYQYHATNQPKRPKAQKPRPQLDSHPQAQDQHPNHKTQFTDYLPQPDTYNPQSQVQIQAQTQPYPIHQEQLQSRQSESYNQSQIQPQVQQPSKPQFHSQFQVANPSRPTWPQPQSLVQTHSEPTKDRQNRTRVGGSQPQVSDFLSEPQSESYQPSTSRWKGEEEEDSDTKVKSAMIHNLLQLPVRHKIPAKPVPKKNANICNVDSMLIFPSASAENYVSFFLTLPDLPEFSVCLWLRVEASHVGTLLSYATHDNDNQVVLFGRNSSASSMSSSASSSSSDHSYSSSLVSPSSYKSASSPSLDFVIGDTVYRRLPVSSLLDAHWHHLCVLWSSIQGRFWYYNDRHLTSSGSNFRKGWEIPGGGSVVLGQEQDSVGGGFDPAEGFAGQMAGFRVWNRVLSPSEVKGVAEGRGVPRGVVLCMEDIKEVHGEVQQVACECLEHCV